MAIQRVCEVLQSSTIAMIRRYIKIKNELDEAQPTFYRRQLRNPQGVSEPSIPLDSLVLKLRRFWLSWLAFSLDRAKGKYFTDFGEYLNCPLRGTISNNIKCSILVIALIFSCEIKIMARSLRSPLRKFWQIMSF